MSDLLQAALWYAEQGFRVFPCQPGGKRPITENGFHDATDDAEQIERWWTKNPRANIGLATAGLFVIDVDGADNKWPNDPQRMFELGGAAISQTPRGGMHYVYRQPDGVTLGCTTGALGVKVDTRGDGGYILVAPSEIDGRKYQWAEGAELCELGRLATPPAWVVDALTNRTDARVTEGAVAGTIPEGQRNTALFRLGCFMRRAGMSQGEIGAALHTANQDRCAPPLPTAEVNAIVESAARYEPDQRATADVEAHYEQDHSTRPEHADKNAAAEDPGSFPTPLLEVPGFMKRVMEWNLKTAHYQQPVLALGGAVCLQAILAARKVRDKRGNRTSLFIIGVGPSACGKEHARQVNREVLFSAGATELEGPDELASDAGLLKAVGLQPGILFQIDEIGRMLKTCADVKQTYLFNIITTLMKLYSSVKGPYKGKAYADSDKNATVDQPCVVLHGSTVPQSLYDSMTPESITNGFMARLMILEVDDQMSRQCVEVEDVPQDILAEAKWWVDFKPGGNLAGQHPSPIVVPTTKEAQEVFDALAALVDEEKRRGDEGAKAIWGRAEEKACRLALVYACSANREKPEIGVEAAQWACALASYTSRRMLWIASQYIAEGQFDAKQKRVIRLLRAHGGRMTQDELRQATRSWKTTERQEVIENLLETGQVVKDESNTGKRGRPGVAYGLRW